LYEGDHVICVLGFHRSYYEALPENVREYWRSGPVRGGPGHTRFWYAYWVKETKHLIPIQADDSVMGVDFVGFRATISMEPRSVATIGPIKFQVPEGYAFQGSRNEGDAVVGNWLDESGGAQTRLEVRIFDAQSLASHSTPEEITRLTESCVQQFLGAIGKRRTDFLASPTRHLSLAGDPAASIEWKGKLDGAPSAGELYCTIAQKRYAVGFYVQSTGDAHTPAVRSAMEAIEAAERRGE